MDKKPSNSTIHFIYWICILSFALLITIAYQWTSQPRFTEYIGNAATLISLVLGVVAIFYSFTSNNNLSQSLGNIANASESLKHSEAEIRNVLDQSKILASNHDENIKKMHQMSENVQSNVSTLSDTLRDISTKTTELQSTVHTFPTRFDAISERLEKNPLTSPPTPVNRQGFSQAQAEFFNKSASVSGNLITYACVLAKKHDVDISIKDFCELVGRNTPSLTIGFFDCMAAAGLITRKSIKDKDGFWKISGIDSEIEKNIKPYFLGFIDRAYKDEPERKAAYLKIIEIMETNFAAPQRSSDA